MKIIKNYKEECVEFFYKKDFGKIVSFSNWIENNIDPIAFNIINDFCISYAISAWYILYVSSAFSNIWKTFVPYTYMPQAYTSVPQAPVTRHKCIRLCGGLPRRGASVYVCADGCGAKLKHFVTRRAYASFL